MKTNRLTGGIRRLAGAAVVLLTAGVLIGQDAVAQIAGTKHNLGTGRVTGVTMDPTRTNEFGATAGGVGGTNEICVFCHTPHGSDTSAAVPLWNRSLPTGTTYTTYNSLGTTSLDGATAPVGSVSLACLSCHDGGQAMNIVINQPGSGGYNSGGAAMAGSWSGTRQNSGVISGIANLGTDLRNDHPIGIQYAGGPKSGTPPTAGGNTAYDSSLFRDADFRATSSTTLNNGTTPVWWVDTGSSGSGTREKTDMLLYTRTVAGIGGTDGTAQPFVECASCHDPHTANPTFLRIQNTASAVCLACHIK